MQYHKFRFGLKGNIKVFICRIFGHRINENPAYHWCERCGLAYEECYWPKDYFTESGLIKSESELIREMLDMNEED
jgi:hypothetical protein